MEIHRNVVNPEIPFQMEQRGAYLYATHFCDSVSRDADAEGSAPENTGHVVVL